MRARRAGARGPAGGAATATRRSIWPAIYPQILELVRANRSTIVFVNNRRGRGAAGALRAATRLRGARSPVARAHHGSLARESGWWSRSCSRPAGSRAGRDQLAGAGNRHGRGGPGDPGRVAASRSPAGCSASAVPATASASLAGSVFPKFRADLLECAVVVRRMREGAIEPTVVPRNPLDVLAQQVVAIARRARTAWRSTSCTRWSPARTLRELSRAQLDGVLDMLDGRYPSDEFGELRPRIVWDRVAGTLRARRGARQLAVTGGTIPDRGRSRCHPGRRRARGTRAPAQGGTLGWSAGGRAGRGDGLRGARGRDVPARRSTWRIEEIARDRVIVSPAPGARRGAVLARRQRRAARWSWGGRSGSSLAGPWIRSRRCWSVTTTSTAVRRATWSTSYRSSRPPPVWCRRTARS